MSEVEYVLLMAVKSTSKLAVLVCFLIFVSGIVVTNMLGESDDPEIVQKFGKLQMSMWSLFQIMTLDHWVMMTEHITQKRPDMYMFFVIYIFCGSVALLALVPGMFIQFLLMEREFTQISDANRSKKDLQDKWAPLLFELFRVMDVDGSGYVSVSELDKFLNEGDCVMKLKLLGLHEDCDVQDIKHGLFLMWQERSREALDDVIEIEVSYEELVDCIIRIKYDLPEDFLHRSTTQLRLEVKQTLDFMRDEFRKAHHDLHKFDSRLSRYERVSVHSEMSWEQHRPKSNDCM